LLGTVEEGADVDGVGEVVDGSGAVVEGVVEDVPLGLLIEPGVLFPLVLEGVPTVPDEDDPSLAGGVLVVPFAPVVPFIVVESLLPLVEPDPMLPLLEPEPMLPELEPEPMLPLPLWGVLPAEPLPDV
jgi:hypothetical protein